MVIDRLLQSTDFERVLRSRSRAQTDHFAVHHVPEAPHRPARRRTAPMIDKLSTGDAPKPDRAVDDLLVEAPDRLWLGAVVPKRHARRSVTRSLLKRQIRAAAGRFSTRLPAGLWVVRLRAPFDRTAFASAASRALRQAAHAELDQLLARAAVRAATR